MLQLMVYSMPKEFYRPYAIFAASLREGKATILAGQCSSHATSLHPFGMHLLGFIVIISIRSAIDGSYLDLLGTRLSSRPVTQGVLSPLQCFTAEFGMDRRGSIATSAPRS